MQKPISRRYSPSFVFLLSLTLLLTSRELRAQSTVLGDPLTGNGSVARTLLIYKDLMQGVGTAPVDDSAFALPQNSAPSPHDFAGRLTLKGVATSGGFRAVTDLYGYSAIEQRKHLPPFDFAFVQSGSHLIPVQQGLFYTGHPYWNYLLGAGRVWKEKSDSGWSRCAIPFALVQRNQNAVHRGSLTFLFNGKSVSNVRYQITQETCTWFKFDMWGQVSAKYTAALPANAVTLKESYAQEVKSRIPTKPLTDLPKDYPDSKVDITVFGRGISPAHRTAYGFFINGTHYVGTQPTRYGVYPFPAELRLPSFSIAKSALASVALMRLAQRYGDAVADLNIKDYLPEAATSRGDWKQVTFNHALDMATGNYDSASYLADENSLSMSQSFFLKETYQDKMKGALDAPNRTAPGKQWVYRTADTFIATTAMNSLLRKRVGANSDLFQMLCADVYTPLDLSAGAMSTLRTDNSPTGKALGGYGLFVTPDDVLKIAKLLNNDGGKIGGVQVLSPRILAAALQKDPNDRGMNIPAYTLKYNNGFWAYQMTPQLYPALKSPIWAVWMSGFGGIAVLLMPNGTTYYHFSDFNEFPSIVPYVLESHKLISQTP
ncbi:MAG: hypothetical protein NT023_21280 [Armatimonadetes bacterium]|nr:hypothetical protein [Armatimonadota bacterium]